jgi:hypothetical protein
MKTRLPQIITILIFSLLIPRLRSGQASHFSLQTSFSQEKVFDYNRAYNDYIHIYNQYREAHTDYVAARQAFGAYKTLTSKTEALNKTLKMLQLRDEVVRTYLTALRMKLAGMTGISNYEQNILYLKLDTEVNWYIKHHNELASAGSLEDLVDSSREAQVRYYQTEVLIYQALGTILASKETTLREKISQEIEILKGKIAEIRQRGDKETTTAERWLLEAENRLTRSQEKQFAAQQILAKIESYDQNKIQSFNQAQFTLEESHQYLKEANSYLKELIREVKRAD